MPAKGTAFIFEGVGIVTLHEHSIPTLPPAEPDEFIPDEIFRLVERKLFDYPQNAAAIKAAREMREDVLQQGRQFDLTNPPAAGQGSPVERKAMRLLMLEEKAQREEFWVKGIEDVLQQLPEEDRKLVELKYFNGFLTNAGVARELGMSDSTYRRRKRHIVRKFAVRFGLV